MSKVLVTESYLSQIANAIRSKLGSSTQYRPGDMANAIESIPTGITPTGTKQITQNGTHDVTQYASANVNVQPNLQSKTATQNGTVTPDQGYDGLSSVVVNVSGGGGGEDYTKLNYSVNDGPLDIMNGSIAGPFDAGSKYIKPKTENGNTLIVDYSQPFEIHIMAKFTQTHSGSMCLCGGVQAINSIPGIEFSGNGAGIFFGISANGQSWIAESIFIPASEMPMVANTWYELTTKYDGTDITATVSDGTNTITKTATPGVALYNNSNYNIEFGGIAANNNFTARYCRIDLSNTYIKANGAMVWGCKRTD